MKLRFWGTRGSHPVSGPSFKQFGGNTHCLEIIQDNQSIIFDSGTGIIPLGKQVEHAKKHSLFISHPHLDHLIGFPFFTPLSDPHSQIEIWIPNDGPKQGKEVLSTLSSPPYFPISLDQFPAYLSFKTLQTHTTLSIGAFSISTYPATHPGSSLCYKIQAGDIQIGLATDNEFLKGYEGSPSEISQTDPFMQEHIPFIEFFRGCDLFIHEAQYFPEEYKTRIGWGHTSLTNGAILMRETGIKKWIVTHHSPEHTDEILQKKLQMHHTILKTYHIPCEVIFAYDGLEYTL